MASKLDYLKKYMSNDDGGDGKKKKKKKKSKVKDVGGLKIIDEHEVFKKKYGNTGDQSEKSLKKSQSAPIDEDEDEALALMTTQEELPQVVGIVDDSRIRTQFTTGGWKDAFAVKQELKDDLEIKKEPKSDDESPHHLRHDSDNEDNSPSRSRRRQNNDSDNDDVSPPRRKRHDSSNSNASPPRRQRHDSDVDNSPPRRRNRQNSDTSPPRRRPKNKGPNNDSDNSPPRAAKRSRFDDNYEPRIKREPDNDSDMSPPRAVKNDDEDLSPPRSSSLMSKTLDGKKAGLQNAKALKEELDMIKAKEKKMFENLSSDVSGRNAETKVRGRLRDKEEEKRLKKERDEAFKIEMTAKYAKWNRGVKQLEAHKAKVSSDMHEMDKPLARRKDDEDLDAHLKAIERHEDPMLQYMRKKQKKVQTDAGLPQYPSYKGPPPPPNRFAIPPGYRWDGVDRSTGFEKRLFEHQNTRKAIVAEAHMWSTEDM